MYSNFSLILLLRSLTMPEPQTLLSHHSTYVSRFLTPLYENPDSVSPVGGLREVGLVFNPIQWRATLRDFNEFGLSNLLSLDQLISGRALVNLDTVLIWAQLDSAQPNSKYIPWTDILLFGGLGLGLGFGPKTFILGVFFLDLDLEYEKINFGVD